MREKYYSLVDKSRLIRQIQAADQDVNEMTCQKKKKHFAEEREDWSFMATKLPSAVSHALEIA